MHTTVPWQSHGKAVLITMERGHFHFGQSLASHVRSGKIYTRHRIICYCYMTITRPLLHIHHAVTDGRRISREESAQEEVRRPQLANGQMDDRTARGHQQDITRININLHAYDGNYSKRRTAEGAILRTCAYTVQ